MESIYYKAVKEGKAVKLKPKDSRQVKKEKFNKLKAALGR
jgi:hypothetical protein